MTPEQALGKIKSADERGQSNWRKEAYDSFLMYNGYQWPDADMEKMRKDGRPPVVFNRVSPLIDAMIGLELANRKEVKFFPRTAATAALPDIMNNVAQWVRADSGLEPAEIDAERDMFISGVGCTATRMNYDDSELGRLDVERVSPMDVRWDANARKRNLTDARWVARYKIMSKEDVKDIWPDAKIDGISESTVQDSPFRDYITYNPATYERHNETRQLDQKGLKVWEFQYWEFEKYWKVENPFLLVESEFFQFVLPDLLPVFGEQIQGKVLNLSDDGYSKLKKITKDLDIKGYGAVKLNKKVFKKLFFCGDVVLQDSDNAVQNHFTLKFITGKRDEKDGCWYGIMRGVKDPQLWANKFMSTLLFIYMHNSKGGVMAEADAIANPEEFRAEWARPDGIMTLNPGALANGKIKEKPKAQLDTAAAEIMRYAIDAIPAVSGINPEVIAIATQNRSNALADTRIKQTATLLLDYFESMTEYRKSWGQMLVLFTKEYLAQEERLIRITDAGTNIPQFITLINDSLADDYDVVAEEGALTMNQKAETWQILGQLFQGQGIPIPLWKYAPIPTHIANEIMQTLQQQQDAQAQQQQQLAQAQAMEMQAKAEKDAALAANAQARTDQTNVETATGVQAQQAPQMQQMPMMEHEMPEMEPREQGADSNLVLAVALEGFKEALEGMRQPRQVIRGEDGRVEGII